MAGTNWSDRMKTRECDFYKARIKAGSSLRTIPKIRGKLNPRQLKKFEETCFGHFLRVSDLQFSAQLCHQILLREVDNKTNLEEMWFYIGGDDISRFSIVEFCIATGLRYSKNNESSHKIDEGLEERIHRINFNSAIKITVQTLESYFDDYVSMDEDDDDIVKLALLLFLEVTLMGKNERHPVDYVYIQVDNLDAFNVLSWGSSIYKCTFDSLSKYCEGRSKKFKKKRGKKPSHKEERYNIYGFVYAFQVWAFETIPSYAEKNYAKRISREIPRILSWEAVKIPTFEDLQKEIFSRQAAVPPLRVLKPTEEERQQSFFTELLEHDVPSQDDLVKGVDHDLSSEIGSLRLEVVAQQEEIITAPENVIIAPPDDKITQELHLFLDELKICKEELHRERENTKKLLNEKVLLKQRISMLEKYKAEEVENLEQERKALKLQVLELERKLEGATQDLATKNADLASLQNNFKELEELMDKIKEDRRGV